MLIKSEFDIQFELPYASAMMAMLHLHPSLERSVRSGNVLVVEHLEPGVTPGFGELIGTAEYRDSFGNRCSRLVAPAGLLRLSGSIKRGKYWIINERGISNKGNLSSTNFMHVKVALYLTLFIDLPSDFTIR